jgi:Spy/CpxP family protein refolding chaperone
MRIIPIIFFLIISSAFLCAQRTIPPDKMSLLKGEGMGLAAPAEFNGFPGPKHVLEMKESLGLTPTQVKTAEALMQGVQASARIVGEEIVEAEERLDSLFATSEMIDRNVLEQLLRKIAALRADLRQIHLEAHIRMKDILTPGQIKLYQQMRGYAE